MKFGDRFWSHILAIPLFSGVTLNKSFFHLYLSFLICTMGLRKPILCEYCKGWIRWSNFWQPPSIDTGTEQVFNKLKSHKIIMPNSFIKTYSSFSTLQLECVRPSQRHFTPMSPRVFSLRSSSVRFGLKMRTEARYLQTASELSGRKLAHNLERKMNRDRIGHFIVLRISYQQSLLSRENKGP